VRELSWARAGRGDRIANVLLYLPVGFCLMLLLNTRLQRVPAAALAIVLGTCLSLSIEVAQVYISSRVPSLTDLALNAAGTALGVGAGIAWHGFARLMHLPTRAENTRRDPGAGLVIGLWLAWRFAPFVPQLDLGKLKAALRPLFSPHFDLIDVFSFLTCWLVVNQAMSSLVSRPRRLEALLLLIAAVLVGRLVVANQAFIASELLALLLLLPMVVVMHRLTPRPRRAVLVFAVATVLAIDALAPFEFSANARGFDLWPFMVWVNEDPLTVARALDWVGLLGTVFLFGALLWAIREWGASVEFAGSIVVVVALGIELAQVWLPQERASITDPLLAVAVAWTFRYVYRRAAPRAFARSPIFPRGRNP
jgi:VanZ family protein